MISTLHTLVPVTPTLQWSALGLQILLFVAFVLHLLLVNALLGGTIVSLTALFSNTIQKSAGVQYSMPCLPLLSTLVAFVVNFGVPVLLFIQVLYGSFFFSSSILIGLWWLSVPIIVILAYYGFYVLGMGGKEYSSAFSKLVLIGISILLLLVMFIFVNNIALMQNPAIWTNWIGTTKGLLLPAVFDMQVIPRYFHFIIGSLAVGGLVHAGMAARSARKTLTDQRHNIALGFTWFTRATIVQFVAGVWFFVSLPHDVSMLFLGSWPLATAILGAGILSGVLSLVLGYKKKFGVTVFFTVVTITLMVAARWIVRKLMLGAWEGASMANGVPTTDIDSLIVFVASLGFGLICILYMLGVYCKATKDA